MYKVMLVDDDLPVLEYLEQALPWEGLGLQLLGGYDESKEALKAALNDMPDILITDIGMPEMDGLELVKQLKQKSPMLQVLIISCHNEFGYAQEALKLNVHEYLLKETLGVETIKPILKTMVQNADNRKSIVQQTERIKQFESKHRSVIKEKLLWELLHTPLWNFGEWSNSCLQQGLDFSKGTIIPVLCRVDRYSDTISKLRLNDETYTFAFDNIASEWLSRTDSGAFFPLDSKTAFLFFPTDSSLHVNPFEMVREQVQEIQDVILKNLKSSTSYYIGQRIEGIQLRSHVSDMLVHGDIHFYERDGTVRLFSKEPFSTEDLFIHYAEAEKELKRNMINGSTEELKEMIMKWFAIIIDKRYHPSMVKEWMLKLMLDLLIKLRTLKHYNSSYSEEVIHQKILAMDSIFHLQDWLLQYMEQITLPQSTYYVQSSAIIRAQNYVARHIEGKISTEEVAKYLHLNPSYFSRMYKQGTGEGFIKYVTRIKMQEACRLLDTTTKTIEEIADLLGYENKSYFNKCFKNVLNVPPIEYRGQK